MIFLAKQRYLVSGKWLSLSIIICRLYQLGYVFQIDDMKPENRFRLIDKVGTQAHMGWMPVSLTLLS